MKSSIFFIVFCVVLLLVLNYLEGEAKVTSCRCHVKRYAPGKCGNNGIQRCLNDVKKHIYNQIIDKCSKCEDTKPPKAEFRICSCSHPSLFECR
ncbi:hypothetical protein YC2023_104376 [Brassica napus]|uniref:(rape) hypothetical protein n=1 Tax=Brassica napus TaxID=3708 RepID=A0A816V4Q3_BRANA|nr:unnamed protein product [Brassica napus]